MEIHSAICVHKDDMKHATAIELIEALLEFNSDDKVFIAIESENGVEREVRPLHSIQNKDVTSLPNIFQRILL